MGARPRPRFIASMASAIGHDTRGLARRGEPAPISPQAGGRRTFSAAESSADHHPAARSSATQKRSCDPGSATGPSAVAQQHAADADALEADHQQAHLLVHAANLALLASRSTAQLLVLPAHPEARASRPAPARGAGARAFGNTLCTSRSTTWRALRGRTRTRYSLFSESSPRCRAPRGHPASAPRGPPSRCPAAQQAPGRAAASPQKRRLCVAAPARLVR